MDAIGGNTLDRFNVILIARPDVYNSLGKAWSQANAKIVGSLKEEQLIAKGGALRFSCSK